MIDWLGPIIHEYYSSTENSLFAALDSHEWLAHPGSVGRSILGTAHILDESGEELPPGESGTIWSDGGLMFEYLNDPEKTAAARNEIGWTTVGDLGYLDEDGYLYLSDRRADLILSGGVNIYPRESEDVLVVHPKVADAAVFGIPHDELGEVVHAVVQPAPGVAERQCARGRTARVPPGEAVDLQMPAPDRFRRRVASSCHRQAVQAAAARSLLAEDGVVTEDC